jgi:prepilin-type processing-associated H-X9-DG protein
LQITSDRIDGADAQSIYLDRIAGCNRDNRHYRRPVISGLLKSQGDVEKGELHVEHQADRYVDQFDGVYPQTKRASSQPDIDDASGGLEEPEAGSVFDLIYPFVGYGQHVEGQNLSEARLYACPDDVDPFGNLCAQSNPDAPDVTSYLANAYFVFGLSESGVDRPANTIYFAERRSQGKGGTPPYCDYIYRPWWNADNPLSPENEMDPVRGAVASGRHNDLANYVLADGHAKAMYWTQTYSPPTTNLHLVKQP